jgi:hypothetical protein
METLIIILLIVIICIAISVYSKKKRREALLAKYGDEKVVDMIMRRMFWQGQTPEQLIDSLGEPIDIDHHVMKTKTKEVWKYNKMGKKQFGLRITLENGIVVGWDQK